MANLILDMTALFFCVVPLVCGLILYFKPDWSVKDGDEKKLAQLKAAGRYFMIVGAVLTTLALVMLFI